MITLIVSVNGVLIPPSVITLIVSVNGVLRPTQRDYTDSVCEWGVETRPT